MYCIYCAKELDGKFCPTCGHNNISSEKEWLGWKSRYSDYNRAKLGDMISHSADYQEDAIIAAKYLLDTYVDDEPDEIVHEEQQRSSESQIWYYSMKGERIGPVTDAVIIQLYMNGIMSENSAVWKAGFKDWVSLEQSGIVLPQKQSTTPPPLAVKDISNKAIIFLLFVPIISTIVQYLIAGIFYIDASKLWWIAYGLNTLCCAIDYYNLKKAGHNTSKLMIAFLFLIPLYIYKRMAMVKGKKWLATGIWIVVFVVDLLIPNMFWVKTIGLTNPAVITSVQDGYFYSYPELKLDRMFNKALDDCEWETYMGGNRRVLVKVSGLLEGKRFETIFEMKIDNSFEVSSMRYGGNQLDSSTINRMIAYLCEEYN